MSFLFPHQTKAEVLFCRYMDRYYLFMISLLILNQWHLNPGTPCDNVLSSKGLIELTWQRLYRILYRII